MAVAHGLRRRARQRGTKSAAAIHDDFRVQVGIEFFQIAFQNAFAQMHGHGGVTGVPFVVFAHVQQHGLRLRRNPGAGFGHADFADAFFGVGDQFEKTG